MSVRRLSLALVGTALLLTPALFADPKPEATNDPLPPGAKARFGVTRPILRTGPAIGLIPPACTNFLAPTLSGGVRRYDLAAGRPLDKNGVVGPGHVVVAAEGKRAVVAWPGGITVVEVATGKTILAVTPAEGVLIVGISGVALSADGTVLAYGARGRERKGVVIVWDVDRNRELGRFETAQTAAVHPNLSPDGKTVITHGPPLPPPTVNAANQLNKPEVEPDSARTAQVWDVETRKELCQARVTGMGGRVVTSAFTPDGSIVAVSAGDGPVDLWEVKTGKRLHTLLGRKGQGVRVAIAPDGKTVASIAPDYRIQRWNIDGTPLGVTVAPPGLLVAPITGLMFADNERVVAWQTAFQFAIAWEAPTTKLLSPEMLHAAAIRSVALPADGKSGLTSGIDGRVFGWDPVTGALAAMIDLNPARLPGQPLILPVVTISADGTRAIWPLNPIAEVFDMGTWDNLFIVPPPSSPPAAVGIYTSPDGLKAITTSRQVAGKQAGSCVIWDLMTQKRVAEFDIAPSAHTRAPLAALSPDGSRLVIATTHDRGDKQVLAFIGYDTKTGKKIAEVEDATASGTLSMAVVDDTWVIVTSTSGRVWAVDYATGQVLEDIDNLPVRGELPITGPVVLSNDGKCFAIGVVGEPFTTYGTRVYDWPQRKALHTFIGHRGPVTALRFAADGKTLASGAEDTSVLIWDLTKLGEAKE
jgi:WD40 repeat protein